MGENQVQSNTSPTKQSEKVQNHVTSGRSGSTEESRGDYLTLEDGEVGVGVPDGKSNGANEKNQGKNLKKAKTEPSCWHVLPKTRTRLRFLLPTSLGSFDRRRTPRMGYRNTGFSLRRQCEMLSVILPREGLKILDEDSKD
jgi:hypothetical protein